MLKVKNRYSDGLKKVLTAIAGIIWISFQPLHAQSLSGIHTIDTTGNGDYTTFQAAANDLEDKGVSGPVVMKFKAGTYKEQVIIDSIPGTSAQNTVTFEPSVPDTSKVRIQYTGNSNQDSGQVIRIRHADHLVFRYLSVKGIGWNASAFAIRSGATHITIEHCNIISDREDGIEALPIITLQDIKNPMNNIVIRDNHFVVDNDGVNMLGTGNAPLDKVTIRNNTLETRGNGIRVITFKNLTVEKNILKGKASTGLSLMDPYGGFQITQNKWTGFDNAVFIGGGTRNIPQPGVIANNFFQAADNGFTHFLGGNVKVKFYYNSFNVSGSGGYVVDFADSCTYYNNVFAHTGGGYVVSYDTAITFASDHNDLYTSGKYFGFDERNFDTLRTFSDFKNLSGTDPNSVQVDPQFKSVTDLHSSAGGLIDQGKVVSGITKDIDGDARGGNPDIGADEITLKANLQPQSLAISPSTVYSGGALQLDYQAKNMGGLTLYGPWSDAIYLSRDQKPDGSDKLLKVVHNNLDLAPLNTYRRKPTVTIPEDTSGTFWILVDVDKDRNLFEDASDNVLASSGTLKVNLSPRPELKTFSVSLPQSTFSGKSFVLEWQVKNTGKEATQRGWSDYIFAARDSSVLTDPAKFNPDSLFVKKVPAPAGLDTGKAYTSSAGITLPVRYSGTRYYMVVTDFGDDINEVKDLFTDNGRVSQKMTVTQSPLPDLKLESYNIPKTGFSGEYIPFTYTVKNYGNAQTIQDGWTDRLVFTFGPWTLWTEILLHGNYKEKKEFAHYGVLQPDSSYTIRDSIRPGNCTFDSFRVYLELDHLDKSFELSEGNNREFLDSLEVVIRPKPDLKVSSAASLTSDPASGKRLEVKYEIINDGFKDAYVYRGWVDRVYLGKRPVFDRDSLILIGLGSGGDSTLAKGDSYMRTKLLNIPDSVFGKYYLFVQADASDQLCEVPNEDNNRFVSSSPLNISLTPPPDLVPGNFQNIPGTLAGSSILVDYTVKNDGTGKTADSSWKDKIYLVKKGERLKDGTLLWSENHTGTLDPGESYSFSRSLTIPLYADSGQYNIVVYIDREDDIFEHQSEQNNRHASNTFKVDRNYARASDLAVTSLGYTGQAKSGHTITVNYNVKNLSKATTVTSWIDKVYLLNSRSEPVKKHEAYHFGALDSLETYSRNISFDLPHGRNGDYILKVQVDTTHKVLDYRPGNDIRKVSFHISLTPPPDLRVSLVNTPDTARSGQPLLLSWLVDNQGPGKAADTPWVDKIYLSKDTLPDENDIFLKREKVRSVVGSGRDYQRSLNPRLPLYVAGNYYLLVKADAGDDLYEANKEDNNTGYSAKSVYIFRPLPSDLVQDGPLSFGSGKYLSYSVKNQGSHPATGSWTDVIYLSKDDKWSKDDLKIDTTQHSKMDVSPGQTYAGLEYLNIPVVRPGYYHFIVKIDGFNYIPETDLGNNIMITADSFYLDNITDLPMDSMYRAQFRKFSTGYYEVSRPANTGMIVRLLPKDDNSSTELYHKTGNIPDRNNYDHKYDRPHQARQKLLIPSENSGVKDYLNAYPAFIPHFDTMGYRIIAESATYSVFSIYPERGGEYGIVSPVIRGFDFEKGMTFELRNQRDTIRAFHVFVKNTTQATAHFDLRDHDTGYYDVVAIKGPGKETRLQKGFHVIEKGFPDKYVVVSQPSLVRPERDFEIQVHYGNRGLVNDYDVFLVVAFFTDSLNTEDFDLHYMGSSVDRFYPDLSQHPNPPNDSNIIEAEGVKYFLLHFPFIPSKGRSDLTFRLQTHFQGDLFTYAFMFCQPASPFSFTGRFDDISTLTTFREIAGTFTNHINDIEGSGKAGGYDCNDLNYNNIRGDLARETIEVAQVTNPQNVTGQAGKSLFTKAKNHVVGNVKSTAKDAGKQAAKDYILKDKGIGESVSDGWEDFTSGVNPFEDPPFGKLLKTVGECIDNDVSRKEVGDCIKKDCYISLDDLKEYCTGYKVDCPDDPGDPDDGDKTDSEPAKDPNEIIGPAGITELRYIKTGNRLIYTIFFENVPEAKVPAQEVVIRNGLQEDFRLQDFTLLSAGFGDKVIDLPQTNSIDRSIPLGPAYGNNELRLVAGLNVINNQAFWRFTTINPSTGRKPVDPGSGFLPPNDSTGIGQGFVKYEIRLKDTVSAGTEIGNQASIIFDSEKELKTNVWTNVVAGSSPASFVKELPRYQDTTRFTVRWEGIDGKPFGVGLKGFDIFYSKDNGPFNLWLNRTTARRAEFSGKKNSTYRFLSIAIANDGTREEAPGSFDAVTTLGEPGGIENTEGSAPASLDMVLYPNPVKAYANVLVNLPGSKEVDISVYDLPGKKVKHIYSGKMTKGWNKLEFSTGSLREGIYFLRLHSSDGTVVRKFIQAE